MSTCTSFTSWLLDVLGSGVPHRGEELLGGIQSLCNGGFDLKCFELVRKFRTVAADVEGLPLDHGNIVFGQAAAPRFTRDAPVGSAHHGHEDKGLHFGRGLRDHPVFLSTLRRLVGSYRLNERRVS